MGNKWERWKEKLNNIFFEEIEVDEEDPLPSNYADGPRKESDVHTKVTYQYPNKSSFRFPVIPDEKETKKESSLNRQYIPAKVHYKPRESANRRPHRTYKRRDSNYQKYKQEKRMKIGRASCRKRIRKKNDKKKIT